MMKTLSIYRASLLMGLLLAFSVSAFLPSNAPTSRRHAHRPMIVPHVSSSSSRPSRTELQMGLRNFIKKKVQKIRKKGSGYEPGADGDDSSFNEPPATPGTGNRAPLETTTKDTAKIIQNAASTAAAKAEPKTVRMGEDPRTGKIDVESRLGPESVQERISRIKRGEMSQEEKEAFLKSALSTGNTPESRLPMRSATPESSSQDAKASPFPKDSILRNMARGNKPYTPSQTPPPPPLMDSQSKKQRYLEMVTDPRRFNNLSSMAGGVPKNDSENPSADEELVPSEEVKGEPNLPQDLGARLGAAAMENEKRNAEIRRRQAEKQALSEQQQREREKRLMEAQQQRQELMAEREADIIKRRRAHEREQAKRQKKSNEAEAARRAELMKAQDDYWARKLAEQKATTAISDTPKQEEAEAVETTDEDVEDSEEQDEDDVVDEIAVSEPISEVAGRPNLNDVSARVPDPQSDLMQRKAALEDEQLARLRSLNSPLPARSQKTTNNRPIRKAAFEPQVPVNTRAQTPAQTLGDVTNTIRSSSASASPPTQSTPDPVEPPVQPKPAPKQETLLNPFARFGGGNNAKSVKPKAAPAPAPRPSPAPVARAPRPAPRPAPAPAPPKRKGPIRMELPLGDEEEEPAMTEGMTIGEIMKRQKAAGNGADQDKRSKQWGVDMSRFQE